MESGFVVLEAGERDEQPNGHADSGLQGDAEVTAKQAAALLRIDARTLKRHIQSGKLPASKRLVNNTPTYYIRAQDVEDFRTRQTQRATDLADNGGSEASNGHIGPSGALVGATMPPAALVGALREHLDGQTGQIERLAHENGRLDAENARLLAENAALEAKIAHFGRANGVPAASPARSGSLGAILGRFARILAD